MPTYRVVGRNAFLGHPPGSDFTANLDEALEQRAIARGAIEKKRRAQPAAPVSPLTDLTRGELEARATEAGVENPQEFPNKAALADAVAAPNTSKGGS